MKVIDLLNKIAKNEIKQGTKFEIDGCGYIYNNGYIAKDDGNKTMETFYISQRLLNDEVEILEEKKIPEKLPYYSIEKIQKAKNKDEWREERITLLEKRVNDLHIKMNDLLDYLKSKGE